MNEKDLFWMRYSIENAQKSGSLNLCVGAVLVSAHNELIWSFFSNDSTGMSWSEELLSIIKEKNLIDAQSLYLTVNTIISHKEFDLSRIIKEIKIGNIYFGLPDPSLNSYLTTDPVLSLKNIYRYPDFLQKEILKQNENHFSNSKQSIRYNQHYSTKRISNLVMQKLNEVGIPISKKEIDSNKQLDKLAIFISTNYGLELQKADNILKSILSESFNDKYSSYNYADDARSIDQEWKNNFLSFYNKVSKVQMEDKKVLNIGVGSGNEAIALFSKCKDITFVDIALNGLEKIKKEIPNSKIHLARAERLSELPSDEYDFYISLRTYNSSFFNIKQALLEAYRVLKNNAKIIISIANGFLYLEQKQIIPGLLIPGTDFVDLYRGLDMMRELFDEFTAVGFIDIKVFVTNTEIYLSAIANKKVK